jgi:hypothetical protein
MNKVNTHSLSFMVSIKDDIQSHFENTFIPNLAKECEVSFINYNNEIRKELNQIYADLAMTIVLKIINKDNQSGENDAEI